MHGRPVNDWLGCTRCLDGATQAFASVWSKTEAAASQHISAASSDGRHPNAKLSHAYAWSTSKRRTRLPALPPWDNARVCECLQAGQKRRLCNTFPCLSCAGRNPSSKWPHAYAWSTNKRLTTFRAQTHIPIGAAHFLVGTTFGICHRSSVSSAGRDDGSTIRRRDDETTRLSMIGRSITS